MKKETYMKILYSALLRLEEKQSLCALDTIMRIDGENIGLFGCIGCVFRDMLKEEICPLEVKGDIYALRWWVIKK